MKFMKYDRYMSGTPEEKVLHYIETHDHKPLKFSTMWRDIYGRSGAYTSDPTPPKRLDSVNAMVDWAIEESLHRYTQYLIGGKLQCELYRRRSSFDIWRIIRYYNPEIDLFSVMRYMISLKDIARSYCGNVRKRVFRYNNNIPTTSYDYTLDEYGLYPTEWEHIGESSA